VPSVIEATPLGAAMLAGMGVGEYRNVQDAYDHVCKPSETYEPDARLTKQYAEWFEVYRLLYPTLKPVHYEIAEHLHH
jgi:sugar (pentulose or hexulose) kinase